jgi:hypothetical protein
MIAGCIERLDVYYKASTETTFKHEVAGSGQTVGIRDLIPFTEYDVKATVKSPDGEVRDSLTKTIKTAEDSKLLTGLRHFQQYLGVL